MTRSCGCLDGVEVVDPARHAAWHAEIAPLPVANAATLRPRGVAVPAERTFIDDQFDASRASQTAPDA